MAPPRAVSEDAGGTSSAGPVSTGVKTPEIQLEKGMATLAALRFVAL